MPMPICLYHATPKVHAQSIVTNGLKPRSVGGEEIAYLCMSGTEVGAVTLGSQASDIIFRVKSSKLKSGDWSERGAGKNEWRSTIDIPGNDLEYRRNLGDPRQKTWRAANEYPKGM